MKQRGAPVEWFAIAPAIGRANGIGIVAQPPHPHAAALFADFLLSPEGQAILQKGGNVPANLRVADPAQKLPLKFVDPALMLDEFEKWKKLWARDRARRRALMPPCAVPAARAWIATSA